VTEYARIVKSCGMLFHGKLGDPRRCALQFLVRFSAPDSS
jgi:hypothetical protein